MAYGIRRAARAGAVLIAALTAACGAGSGSHPAAQTTPPATTPPPAPPLGTTAGPWPVANQTFGASDGIQEADVVGMTTDESQNRWVATQDALYVMRPGDTSFHRYGAKDGLHLQGNPARYCRDAPVSADAPCSPADESWGAAEDPGITAVEGGGPNEVFVGYMGRITDPLQCNATGAPDGTDWCDPLRHDGKIDRVKLNADGTITVDRFDLLSNAHGGKYWHDRWIQRLLYDHFDHPHTLYSGSNHGVTILFPDLFRLPNPGEWFDTAYSEWMGDHLHARVCFEAPCTSDSNQRMGDWKGLALDANGDLWHAGKWTAGLITFDPSPHDWFARNGAAFKTAFGDPYYGPGDGNTPVFPVAKEGHPVYLTAVAVCPDGKVWFGSAGPSDGVTSTIASWDGKGFTYYDAGALGAAEPAVADLVCLPDGRLAIAGPTTGIVVVDPANPAGARRITAGSGLPDDRVNALEVDRMVKPWALLVGTAGGAASLRVLP